MAEAGEVEVAGENLFASPFNKGTSISIDGTFKQRVWASDSCVLCLMGSPVDSKGE
jgi:hypothetical protein